MMKSANAKSRRFGQDQAGSTAGRFVGDAAGLVIRGDGGPWTAAAPLAPDGGPADRTSTPGGLSVRAMNVLKELAVELTGEQPPQGVWTPSDQLIQKLTFRHLSTARNCGPRTIAEIIKWAEARGKTIRRSFHAGKSLSAMWQDAIAKFSAGDISKAEIAEVLERSARRNNTRIPVAFQRIILQLVVASGE